MFLRGAHISFQWMWTCGYQPQSLYIVDWYLYEMKVLCPLFWLIFTNFEWIWTGFRDKVKHRAKGWLEMFFERGHICFQWMSTCGHHPKSLYIVDWCLYEMQVSCLCFHQISINFVWFWKGFLLFSWLSEKQSKRLARNVFEGGVTYVFSGCGHVGTIRSLCMSIGVCMKWKYHVYRFARCS